MGLDLVLYKSNKPFNEMSMEEELESELAYGRKTWAIAEFLYTRSEDVDGGGYEYKVSEEVWDLFIDRLSKLVDPEFREKVEDYLEYDYEYMNGRKDPDEKYEAIYLELEDWLNDALDYDTGYALGLEWELSAVLRWFDADWEVREAYKNGYEVRLIVSF